MTLLSHSPRRSVGEGQAHLARFQLPRAPRECRARLVQYRDGATMLMLYRHFFPDAFARASPPLRVSAPTEPSQHEREFLELVNRHLFPLDSDVYDAGGDIGADDEDGGYLLTQIGIDICCLGLGDWYDDYPDGLDPICQTVLVLSGNLPPADINFSFHECRDAEKIARELLWDVGSADPIDYDRLYTLCAENDSPLVGLPDVIDLLDHNTGSPWLDQYSGMGFNHDDLVWSIENITWLADNFRDVHQPIIERVERLQTWFEADVASNLPKVIELWQNARKSAPAPTSLLGLTLSYSLNPVPPRLLPAPQP